MTTAEMVAILKELHALEHFAASVTRQTDLTETFTWQCVIAAIRDRRQKLLDHADAQLNEPVSNDRGSAFATNVPPGRVH